MKTYPSILKNINSNSNETYYCFDKLDGSNIRAEWSKKRSFYKFGTRTRLLDANEPILGQAVNLVKTEFEKELHDIFIKQRQERVMCFFELYGKNSFAGQHAITDKMELSLLDVSFYKRGIIHPKEFISLFGRLNIASLLYYGNINNFLITAVKERTLAGMTFEGIVCKSKNPEKMIKIKSNDWIEKLKKYCAGNLELFNELV